MARASRKVVVSVAVVVGFAAATASLLAVTRAWSTACCDPAGIMRGADGGIAVAWPDLDHEDAK